MRRDGGRGVGKEVAKPSRNTLDHAPFVTDNLDSAALLYAATNPVGTAHDTSNRTRIPIAADSVRFNPAQIKRDGRGRVKAHDPKQTDLFMMKKMGQPTDPVTASQAPLKPSAMDLGRYVLVVPLLMIKPLSRWKEASASMLIPSIVMSITWTSRPIGVYT